MKVVRHESEAHFYLLIKSDITFNKVILVTNINDHVKDNTN